MPRSVEAPVNLNVHSASREEGNSRLIVAEMRLERFYVVVFFDYSDKLFHFKQSEHNRELDHITRPDSERPLVIKMLYAMQKITEKRIKETRFEQSRPLNQDWAPMDLDVPIRRFHPGKVRTDRTLFDRYKPFDPTRD